MHAVALALAFAMRSSSHRNVRYQIESQRNPSAAAARNTNVGSPPPTPAAACGPQTRLEAEPLLVVRGFFDYVVAHTARGGAAACAPRPLAGRRAPLVFLGHLTREHQIMIVLTNGLPSVIDHGSINFASVLTMKFDLRISRI
jgi:hypothetical protein